MSDSRFQSKDYDQGEYGSFPVRRNQLIKRA